MHTALAESAPSTRHALNYAIDNPYCWHRRSDAEMVTGWLNHPECPQPVVDTLSSMLADTITSSMSNPYITAPAHLDDLHVVAATLSDPTHPNFGKLSTDTRSRLGVFPSLDPSWAPS